MLAPTLIWFMVFLYKPMYGLQIAFKDYSIFRGVAASPWVGLEHFQALFSNDQFIRAFWNTIKISALNLLFGFPAPIILALMFNEILHATYKRTAQTIVYLPHFISSVIIAGIVITAFSPSVGIVNTVLGWFGLDNLIAANDQVISGISKVSSGVDSASEKYGLEWVDTDRFGGFMLTLVIGVTGIVCSLPLGILLALGRQSNLHFIRWVCTGFIEFMRGVPLITLLFVASTMLNYFLPPGTTFDLLLRVLIMVSLFSAAYIAEVVRGGLQAIPKGQREAADAMGLKYWASMRLVVLPQALKISIPGIVNSFIGLFKDTVLVVIIGLLDPLGIGRASLSDIKWQGLSTEVYVFIAIFFFICCFSMSRYSIYLEDKLHTGHRND